jgi:MraZ protein
MQISSPASYSGTFAHSFDEKGRITVPADWREEGFENRLVAFPGRKCIKVYPFSWIGEKQAEMKSLKAGDPQRQKFELLLSIAHPVKWDNEKGQGRIMIKEELRKEAGVRKEALLAGCGDHFEIWDVKRREAELGGAKITFEDAAEALGI